MQLNEAQLAAVEDVSKALLVRANVGSGKTTVLTEKVRFLHEKKNVPYEKMAVMTFTRKAAREIRERLGDTGDSEELYFGTFHAAAAKLLRKALPEKKEEGALSRDFSLILPEEELELARVLIRKNGLKVRYPNRLEKRLERGPEKEGTDDLNRLIGLLDEEKKRSNRADYADLITMAASLWRAGKGPAFDWVIIDEVQDCDRAQLEMVDAMMSASPEACLFAVGDPGQMIYGFRKGVTGVFQELAGRYGARMADLEKNYRSGAEILKAAKWFRQGGAPLSAARDTHAKITVRSQTDPFSEAGYLASKIRRIHDEGTKWERIAVLFRLREQSGELENAFAREGIPYQLHRRAGTEQSPAGLWFKRVLRALDDPGDEISLALALEDKQYTGKYSKELEEKIRSFKEVFPDGACDEEIWTYIGPEKYLHPTSARYQEDLEAARLAMAGKDVPDDPELTDALSEKEEPDEGREGVRLMTLHASKGLEFDHVFIIGVNDGLIPLSGVSDEEEQRLFYVGMTRARDALELSFYLNPGRRNVLPGEGRYLKRIPAQLTNREVPEGPAVSMKELRLMVLEEKKKSAGTGEAPGPEETGPEPDRTEEKPAPAEEASAPGADKTPGRRVSHDRYGTGTVIREDEMNITVLFDDYGEKEFLKAFAALREEDVS